MILKHMKLPILSGPQEGLPRPRQIKKKKETILCSQNGPLKGMQAGGFTRKEV